MTERVRADVLFLDFGGVIHDGIPLHEQWKRLLGEFFPPRLGGTPASWAHANAVAVQGVLREHWNIPIAARGPVHDYYRRYYLDWMTEMCRLVGIQAPPADQAEALAREATRYVIERTEPTIPGVADAVRQLKRLGYTLHMAGGPASWELEGYLNALGVRELFDNCYGPDLIGIWKDGPRFYEAILSHADVDPRRAVVVDDTRRHLAAAREAGVARTFLVSAEAAPGGPHTVVASLTELVDALDYQ